jgi:hypothetical protein
VPFELLPPHAPTTAASKTATIAPLIAFAMMGAHPITRINLADGNDVLKAPHLSVCVPRVRCDTVRR